MLEAMLDMYRGVGHQLSGIADVTGVPTVNSTKDLSGGESSADDEGPSSYAMDDEETAHRFGNRLSMSRSIRRPDDSEKTNRRAIANSNERRRMQSINAGFQQLKELVRPGDTEKLSKAAVLQHAVDFIIKLKCEKQRLAVDNEHLLGMLGIVPSSSSPRIVDSVPLQHQHRLHHAFTTSATVSAVKYGRDDDELCPRVKRARLLDDAASLSASGSSYCSSFSSSSSVSSDEGVAELSGPVRPSSSMPTTVPCVEATVTDGRWKPSTAPADAADRETAAAARHRRAEQDPTGCGISLVDGGDRDSVSNTGDRLAMTSYGDGAWNCAKRRSSLDDQPSQSVIVKQENADMLRDVTVETRPSVFDRLVATSGDAVVPVADNDSVEVKQEDRAPRRRCLVECNWATVSGDHVVGPEDLAVVMANCRSPSPNMTSSSMSQRNLETILEAIRYLEGDGSCQDPQPMILATMNNNKSILDGLSVR